LSNAQLNKLIWIETLVYASYLMNRLSSSAIWTPLEIWSDRAAQDYDLLKIFECHVYFRDKEGKLDLVFFGVKRNLKGYKLWTSKTRSLCWASMSHSMSFNGEANHLLAYGDIEN